jgi:uncharacterized membrane protein YraQ (UPF0718 family)
MSASVAAASISMAGVRSGLWRNRVIALVLLATIGSIFWIDSRYPSLMKKYHAGTKVKASGAITFDMLYPVEASMPLQQRVWRTSINWLNANRIGMTFAFFFGPAALVFLATLSRKRSKSKLLNALIGMLSGMPLGVCANCVAPIGRGLYKSGMSTESVLAAMFSSPALNVVVAAMTFALFPLQLALLKLATVLVLIFGFAPMIAAGQKADADEVECPIDLTAGMTWGQALKNTSLAYAKSFWEVFRVGFPLMLLAAVLGALVIELAPAQAINAPVSIAGILLLAIVGAFLPVPMAFDVVIAYIAMTHGVPLPYVAVILCTLGIYSVYSATVVGKTISWRVAGAAFGAVAAIGVIAGLATRIFS